MRSLLTLAVAASAGVAAALWITARRRLDEDADTSPYPAATRNGAEQEKS